MDLGVESVDTRKDKSVRTNTRYLYDSLLYFVFKRRERFHFCEDVADILLIIFLAKASAKTFGSYV